MVVSCFQGDSDFLVWLVHFAARSVEQILVALAVICLAICGALCVLLSHLHKNTLSYKVSFPFYKWGKQGCKRNDTLPKARALMWIQECLNPTREFFTTELYCLSHRPEGPSVAGTGLRFRAERWWTCVGVGSHQGALWLRFSLLQIHCHPFH